MLKFNCFSIVVLTVVLMFSSFALVLNVSTVYAKQEAVNGALILVSEPFFLSTAGKPVTKLTVDSPTLISSNLTNLSSKDVDCAFIVQIEDARGIIFKNLILLTVPAGKTYTAGIMWTPEKIGNFTLKIWCQRSVTNLTKISNTVSFIVSVGKPASTITVLASPLKVKIGEEVFITGKIEPPRVNVEVTITYARTGKVEATHKVITTSDGIFSDVFKPNLSGVWEVYASWLGDSVYDGATSKSVTFTAAKISTSLEISPLPREVDVGKKLTIEGKITPPLAGVEVTLTYIKAGGVKIIHISTTNLNGVFTDTITPDAGGTWKVKASWKGDEKYEASESQELTFEAVEKRCIVATATYESELAPQVQCLRGFRETIVYKTYAGSQFMKLFNAWYYAWSPYVANLIWTYPTLKPVVQVILYPLLWILYTATLTYTVFSFNGEIGIFMAGLVTGILVGLIYFTPITLVITLVLRKYHSNLQLKQNKLKPILFTWLTSIILLALGEIFSPTILTVASGFFMILTIALTTSLTTIKLQKLVVNRKLDASNRVKRAFKLIPQSKT
ncbi:MAG: CFI-box-CTERM domain-containing protein [Candidatus Bathyarchaeota archaeon]